MTTLRPAEQLALAALRRGRGVDWYRRRTGGTRQHALARLGRALVRWDWWRWRRCYAACPLWWRRHQPAWQLAGPYRAGGLVRGASPHPGVEPGAEGLPAALVGAGAPGLDDPWWAPE